MKILILGFSKIVQSRVLPAINKIQSIRVVDVASFRSSESIVKQLISGDFYNNYDDALKKSNADIVYISLVNSEHFKWVDKALNHNFHVIVDKPAFLNKADALSMLKLAKEKNKCLAEALVYQYHPQIDILKKTFSENNIKPISVSAHFSFPSFNDGNFRNEVQFGGGAINDLGPYALSIGRFIFDEIPLKLSVISNKNQLKVDNKVDVSFTLMIEFTDSKTFIGYFGFGTEYINSVMVLGDGLNVKSERIFTTVPDVPVKLNVRKVNKESEIIVLAEDSFKLFIENVVGAINNNDFENHYNDIKINAVLLDQLINSK